MWLTIARFAFTVLITAIGKIPADQWAKLGAVITSWLQALQAKLPKGHPALKALDAFQEPDADLDDADRLPRFVR